MSWKKCTDCMQQFFTAVLRTPGLTSHKMAICSFEAGTQPGRHGESIAGSRLEQGQTLHRRMYSSFLRDFVGRMRLEEEVSKPKGRSYTHIFAHVDDPEAQSMIYDVAPYH